MSAPGVITELVPINANRLTRTGRKMPFCVCGRCGIAKDGEDTVYLAYLPILARVF
jgi:hypothetical protein